MPAIFARTVTARPAPRGVLATRWAALSLLALAGCPAPVASTSYVLTHWRHEPPRFDGTASVAPGIDLDARNDAVEGEGCTGPLDFVSPSGRVGIDNQYAAALVPWLDAALGDTSDAVEASPDHLWILDIEGIDDLRDEVDVTFHRASMEDGAVVRGAMLARRTGTLVGEWLEVDLGAIDLPMGAAIGPRTIDHARLRLRLFPEGQLVDLVEGELGGSVPLTTVLSVAHVFEPALDLRSAERMAMPDLDWDGDGLCEAASLGVGFEARRL